MTRDQATSYAAFCGLAGLILVVVGTGVASLLFTAFPVWLAALPALLVWGACVYLGMKQFARGIYEVVDDAGAA